MRRSRAVIRLAVLLALLALGASLAGLLWPGGDGTFALTTARGQNIAIFGQGLYANDTLHAGSGQRGTDLVTLILGLPLLLYASWRYHRGSLRGGIVLLGMLAWFLSSYATAALGAVAYNELFLVYVALFSASLYGLLLTYRSFDQAVLADHLSFRMPQRGPAIFLLATGLLTLVLSLNEPVTSLLAGSTPASLRIHTTLLTNAMAMAVVAPAALLAAGLIWRRDPTGYLLACPILVLAAMYAPVLAAQTVSQVRAGITFTTGALVLPLAGAVILAVFAIVVLIGILRHVHEPALEPVSAPGEPELGATETVR